MTDWQNEGQFQSKQKSWQECMSYLAVILLETLGLMHAINLSLALRTSNNINVQATASVLGSSQQLLELTD